jgi:pimeloyl-ACP methyl ester carboxylesterase
MEYFKKKYTVIWFDYRGHHRSDSPKNMDALTIENIGRDMECLLNELKIPKATLLGHSMGVNLVLEFYRRAPHRVQALVLANGTARGPLATMFRTNIMQLVFPYLYGAYKKHPKIANLIWNSQGKSKLTQWLIGQLGFNPNLAKPEDIQLYIETATRLDMIVTLQLLKDYENYDASWWLHRIDVPTLIIAGEKDHIIPREEQETMRQLIPNSKFELIRNGSHCPQMDLPDLVNVMIERFLNENLSKDVDQERMSSTDTPPPSTAKTSQSQVSRSKSSKRSESSSTTSSAQMSRHGELSYP